MSYYNYYKIELSPPTPILFIIDSLIYLYIKQVMKLNYAETTLYYRFCLLPSSCCKSPSRGCPRLIPLLEYRRLHLGVQSVECWRCSWRPCSAEPIQCRCESFQPCRRSSSSAWRPCRTWSPRCSRSCSCWGHRAWPWPIKPWSCGTQIVYGPLRDI